MKKVSAFSNCSGPALPGRPGVIGRSEDDPEDQQERNERPDRAGRLQFGSFDDSLFTRNRSAAKAFSLMELLMVITILAVLSVLIVPSVSGLSRSYQLNSAGHLLLNNLTQARQAALTRGYPVQVRFYKLPGYLEPASAPPSAYRAMQAFVEGDPIKAGSDVSVPVTALSKPVFFSSPVEIFDSTTYSSVLTLPYTSSPQETLPGYTKNYGYVSFRFKPDGQADLPADASSLTILSKDGNSGNGLPKNFRSFEIDATTGSVREYSP